MASTLAQRKVALAAVRGTWNTFRAFYNPTSIRIAAIPELDPVLKAFKRVADAADQEHKVISDAIKAVGLDAPPSMTPEETALAKALTASISASLEAFEKKTGLRVLAMTLDSTAVDMTFIEWPV